MEQAAAVQTVDVESAIANGRLVFEVMDLSGDTKYEWDPSKPAEVEAARELYEKLVKQGYRAYSLSRDGSTGEQLPEFRASPGRVLFRPAMVGG